MTASRSALVLALGGMLAVLPSAPAADGRRSDYLLSQLAAPPL